MHKHPQTHLLIAAFLLAVLAAPASGQYFGQNKVQYEDFDWKVIATEQLDVHFYARTTEASQEMARAAERWNWRLSQVFDHRLSERKPVVLYANHPDFQQTNIVQGEIGIGTGGVTDPTRNRATQPFTGDFANTSHVVGHELAHVYQFDIANATAGVRAMAALPLWLIEGMAEYLSVGREDPHTAMWMRDAVLRGDIPTIGDLSGGRYFPYRFGQSLMAYIGGRWGDREVTRLYKVALANGLGPAIEEVTGMTPAQLSDAWARDLRATYLPLVQDRDAPERVGRPLMGDGDRSGNVNLAPVLSPDGDRVAFISERGLFSMDLYVADTETGEIVSRLTSSERQPHFDALSFLESAGTWSPDGRYFAYVVVDDGDNELRIADVGRERAIRSIEVPGVPALNDPEWSPDGQRLAFSGSAGGISDLYVYDLDTEQLRRLTSDLHAEVHPSWSPDGATLVFATDRGPATDLDALEFGPLRLAAIDVATGDVRLLSSFEGAKHIDPHFSPDGGSIYFISDRGGVSDIFRLDLGEERFYQVTRTATGISGVTSNAPALTVSSRTGRIAFSIFQDNRYTLHALEPAEAVGTAVEGSADLSPAGVLPPADEVAAGTGGAVVSNYLDSPRTGLPSGEGYTVEDYRPTLGLDYIGPPMVGVSSDQFGTTIGGAVSFAFRDLLGDRTLGVMLQAQGEVQDIGGQVFFQNRESRLNWGVVAGRIPYRSGRRFVDQQASTLLVREQIFRTFQNQIGGMLGYPFSRTRRVEGNASFTRYTFDAEERQYRCGLSGQNCEQIDEIPLEGFESDPVNLYRAAGAFVGDWARFGFTGPIMGGRYRFEAEPTFGDLTFTGALADYRRYLFRNPFTLAFRGMHYGRYGEDAENRRFLSPLYLGNGGLVRGYTMNSFDVSECSAGSGQGSGCPEFDRLVGSRVALTNLELRVPLFGTADFGLIPFPLLPTTVGAFFDAGVAWTAEESPELEFSTTSADRIPVASTGVFARFNVLGYMVVSTWLAHPFQRPAKDLQFGFDIAPGW